MKNQTPQFLIIDPDPASRALICESIRSSGYGSPTETSTMADALKILRTGMVDFIISEWDVPKASGLSLLKLIKRDKKLKHIPFILVTGASKDQEEKISKASRELVDGYLIKPFPAATFRTTLDSIIFKLPSTRSSQGVLIVDDDEESRETMVSYLDALGIEKVFQAGDGMAARKILLSKGREIALVISDWDMPNANGLEFLKFIRKHPQTSTIPFMMVTAQVSVERSKVMNAIHSSVDAYLFKPFRLQEFKEKIISAMKKAESTRQFQHLMAMGYLLIKDGYVHEAMGFFSEARTLAPQRAEPYQAVGNCLFRIKNEKLGCEQYEKALAINPLDELIYIEFAEKQDKFSTTEASIGILQRGIKANPGSYELHVALSRLYLKRGKNSEAATLLDRALELNPDGADALVLKARKRKGPLK